VSKLAIVSPADALAQIKAQDEKVPPKIYEADELVPRMYAPEPHVLVLAGAPSVAFGFSGLKNALLYAHKVEATDPIVAALAHAEKHSEHRREQEVAGVLVEAIRLWIEYRPLIESGIINLAYPSHPLMKTGLTNLVSRPGPSEPDTYGAFFAASKRRDFRQTVVKAFPDYLPSNLDQIDYDFEPSREDLDVIIDKCLQVNLVGPLKEPEQRQRVRTWVFTQFLTDIFSTFHVYLDDLNRFLAECQSSHADHWLPSPRHVTLFNAMFPHLAKQDDELKDSEALFLIGRLAAPAGDELTAKDIVTIRKNSDALDMWRECLRQTFHEFNGQIALGRSEHEARAFALEVIRGSGPRLTEQLSKDIRQSTGGILRELLIGAAGAAPGAIIGGSSGALLAAEGVSAAFVASVLLRQFDARTNKAAIKAVRKHLLVTGNAVERAGQMVSLSWNLSR